MKIGKRLKEAKKKNLQCTEQILNKWEAFHIRKSSVASFSDVICSILPEVLCQIPTASYAVSSTFLPYKPDLINLN